MSENVKKPTKPQFIYFLENNPNYDTSSYNKIYKQKLKEVEDYHYNFGKDGFLSEKTYEEDIPMIAKREAEREFKIRNGTTMFLSKTSISPLNYLDIIKETENDPNFIRWFFPLNEQIVQE